ncbi:predicted protein [Botrytis cinerea T4]|uniref:Uncharacterized protein n=1 Tax=Botryotinia fuckeliana (strain T4) TaxID=999810 RepID=G2YMI8_BOTF4|nr:predicted protein [Botrytis cinerea T4]
MSLSGLVKKATYIAICQRHFTILLPIDTILYRYLDRRLYWTLNASSGSLGYIQNLGCSAESAPVGV